MRYFIPVKCVIAGCLLFANNLRAQYDTDSLKAIIQNIKLHDTTRLVAIGQMIDNLYENDQGAVYNEMMGQIARKNLRANPSPALRRKYNMYLAAYYNNHSIHLENRQDPGALAYLEKALTIYRQIEAWDEYYSILVSKGLLLSRKKRYKDAIDAYFSAIRDFEKNAEENADGISYVYSNLASLYSELGQYPESIGFMKQAINNIDRKKEAVTVEDDLQKFVMHHSIGSSYIELNEFDHAAQHLRTALQLAEKHQNGSYQSFALGKLALVDLRQGFFTEAEQKLLKADALSETDLSKAFTLVNLGEVYVHKHNYNRAHELLQRGLALAERLKQTALQQQATEQLYKLYKAQGRHRESVAMLERFVQLKDATDIQATKNELERQQLTYEYDKKALQYKLKAQQEHAEKNNALIVLSSAVLLLLTGGYWLFRNARQKQALAALEKNELKRKLLLTQMNPHFIFNSIDNIQGLIYAQRNDEAVNYLAKFSKLTRQILEHSDENYITLAEEVEMVQHYLGIQQLLYGNRFDFDIHVDESVDVESILLPPMLTQPFIENAIKHGIGAGKGKIAVRFEMRQNQLWFEITDNGPGFDDRENTAHKSMAIKITTERLRQATKNKDFKIHRENLTTGGNSVTGARVFFEIPYICEN